MWRRFLLLGNDLGGICESMPNFPWLISFEIGGIVEEIVGIFHRIGGIEWLRRLVPPRG